MNGRARPPLFVMTGFRLLALSLVATTAARAQGETTDATAQAPPPMKFVPREDRAQLDAERDGKKRTRLSIRLAETSRPAKKDKAHDNFKTLIEYVRDARDRALAGFYDDTILRDFDAEAEKRPGGGRRL